MSRRPGLTWVVALSVIEMIALVIGIGSPGQPLLTGLFVLTCPGFLLLDLPNPRSLAARAMLGVGASLVLNASLIAIDRAGYTLPVAATLILALAVVALLPRDTLRRGIDSIKSMASRKEAGDTNSPAAADRLTPLYVDRQATALVEPDPPTEGDLPPATDDVDLTEPLATDTIEAAPDEDEAPTPEEDEIPVQDEDEAPTPEEDEAPTPEEDAAPTPEEDEVPRPDEDETPAQDEDETPAQDEDEAPAQDEDEAPAQDEDEIPPPEQDEAPAPQKEDEVPIPPEDTPAVATAEDVTALLEELRAADDLYEVTSDQADGAASTREAEDTPSVPDKGDIPPVSVSVDTTESVGEEVDARNEDSESAPEDETTAPPEEVVVESGEEAATQSEAAGITTPDGVDTQPPSIVIFGVDINRAGPEAIAAFPGMEPEPAALIVAYRDRHGPFGDARELVRLLRAIEARQNAKRQASGIR